jgi:hypothetical protein
MSSLKQKIEENARQNGGNVGRGASKRAEEEEAKKDEKEKDRLNLKQTNETIVRAVEKNNVSPAVQVPLTALGDTAQVDVKMKKSVIHTLKGQTPIFELSNSYDTAIPLPKFGPVDFLKYIEITGNDGSDLITQITRENFLYAMRFLEQGDLDLYKSGFVCEDGEELAPNGKRTFYLPLIGDPLVLNEVFLAGIKGDITYSFYFDPAVWGNGNVPSLTKCNMISRHLRYDDDEFKAMKMRYARSNQAFRYRELVDQNWTRTLDPSTDYELLTTQFKNLGSEVFIQIYQAGDQVAELVQHVASYDIEDDDGQSILSSEPMEADYHKIILNAAHGVSNVVDSTASDPWLVIPLSPDGMADVANGSISGMYDFNGGEKLLFKTKSTLVSGTYKIRVFYSKLKLIRVSGGVITIH